MDYDVVLIMVPPWETKRPPLGLAYIDEYLKSRGFNSKVLDFNLWLYGKASSDKKIFWEIHNINSMLPYEITRKMFHVFKNEVDQLVRQILSLNCNIVGFSVSVASIGFAGKIATQIKKKDKKKRIVFGGTGCFGEHNRRLVFPEDINSIDAFVVGEGEESLEKIIVNYRSGRVFKNIKGVICIKGDFLKPTIPFYTQDVDKLPFPTFSGFQLDSYREKTIPMLISRGCIGRCVFCIDHLMCGSYRYRNPEIVIEEIKYHIGVTKTANFAFNDLICNGNLKQLRELCELIIQDKLHIKWGSYAMVRKDMNLELLQKMKESGCIWLCYGVESGCDRTLKKMNKFYTSEEAQRVIRDTHRAGIQTAMNIIVGFPGETEEDFEETLSFVKRNKDHISEITNVSSFVIMLASKIGRNPQDYGVNIPPSGENLSFYTDRNALGLSGRLKRVRKSIFTISNLEIGNVIVNQPTFKDCDNKGIITLIFGPPARIDLPPWRIACLFSYLKSKMLNPVVYDFNIKLYKAIGKRDENLWNCQSWHRWSLPDELSNIFDSFEKKLLELIEKIIFSKSNILCFLTTRENLMFSVKIASVFKKIKPNVSIIFSCPNSNAALICKLVSQGIVDYFIFSEEKDAILEILNGISNNTLPNGINGQFNRLVDCKKISKSEESKANRYLVEFGEIDLKALGYSYIPLRWN